MAEGKINFFECSNTSNNKPTHRGFIDIDGVVHEFACWPSKSGKGWSGKYKPKEDRSKADSEAAQVAFPVLGEDGTIPF